MNIHILATCTEAYLVDLLRKSWNKMYIAVNGHFKMQPSSSTPLSISIRCRTDATAIPYRICAGTWDATTSCPVLILLARCAVTWQMPMADYFEFKFVKMSDNFSPHPGRVGTEFR